MRRVCVVTGTRAEYGLLRWVMEGIRDSRVLDLQVVATAAHLSPRFGLTYRDIEADGFTIDARVDMLLSSDSAAAVTASMGLGFIGLADAYERLAPDIVVLLGDRFETWVAGAAATVARIPLAHVHGGETTEGAIDEAMRHGLTKMAGLHFAAAPEYGRRIVQLGEDPARVHVVGGLGLDSIDRLPLLDRAGLEESLGLDLGRQAFLVTYHPVTLGSTSAEADMSELLAALDQLPDVTLLFTMPNADADGRVIEAMVRNYASARTNAHAFTSLGQQRYLSCLREVDAIVGNSSSGLLEAPTLLTPTVDIGDRQRGRLAAGSVVHAEADRASILAALKKIESPDYLARLPETVNPYGVPGASARIVEILETVSLGDLVGKRFHDLP